SGGGLSARDARPCRQKDRAGSARPRRTAWRGCGGEIGRGQDGRDRLQCDGERQGFSRARDGSGRFRRTRDQARRGRSGGSGARTAMSSPPSKVGPRPSIVEDATELIGRTPLVKLAKLSPPGGASVYGKLESQNPAGSVKDRPALAMITAAEKDGAIKPGATIIEATSGNTGISLAMIAAVRGYKCVLVMPEDMSLERRYVLRAYGAEITLTPATDGMAGAVTRARELAKNTPNSFMPRQFENDENPKSHERTTALEILEQTGGSLDAFVAGV